MISYVDSEADACVHYFNTMIRYKTKSLNCKSYQTTFEPITSRYATVHCKRLIKYNYQRHVKLLRMPEYR